MKNFSKYSVFSLLFILLKSFCIYDPYIYTEIPHVNASLTLNLLFNNNGPEKKLYVIFIYSLKNETCNDMAYTYNQVFKTFSVNKNIKIYRIYANSGFSNLIIPQTVPSIFIIYNGIILKGLNGNSNQEYILTGIKTHKEIVQFISDAYKTAMAL